VAHIYHRIDYEILWATLATDVPRLTAELEHWRSMEMELGRRSEQGRTVERDTGLDIGF